MSHETSTCEALVMMRNCPLAILSLMIAWANWPMTVS